MQSFEYQVCSAQYGHVTFVNNAWRGRIAFGSTEDTNTLIESCPEIWEFLQEAGRDGWELVAVLTRQVKDGVQEVLYMKRPMW
jgi:hypothetical protein